MYCEQDAQASKAAFVNRTQQCFAVRAGPDGLLGLARAMFCRLTEQIHQLADRYRDEFALPGLKARLVHLSLLRFSRTQILKIRQILLDHASAHVLPGHINQIMCCIFFTPLTYVHDVNPSA